MLFDGADLQRAVFVRARLEDVKIRNADLRNADFTDARLEDAFLNGSEVRNAKFVRTDLTGADLRQGFGYARCRVARYGLP